MLRISPCASPHDRHNHHQSPPATHTNPECHAGTTQHTRTHMHATSTQPTMTMHQQNSTNQYHLAGHKHKVLVHHAIEFSNNIRTQHKQPTPNRISHTLRRKHSVTPTQTKNKIRVNTTMHCTPMMPLQRKNTPASQSPMPCRADSDKSTHPTNQPQIPSSHPQNTPTTTPQPPHKQKRPRTRQGLKPLNEAVQSSTNHLLRQCSSKISRLITNTRITGKCRRCRLRQYHEHSNAYTPKN